MSSSHCVLCMILYRDHNDIATSSIASGNPSKCTQISAPEPAFRARGPVPIRAARQPKRVTARKRLEEEGVLCNIELELLERQSAVGESSHERVRQRGLGEIGVVDPEPTGEHTSTIPSFSAFSSQTTDRGCADRWNQRSRRLGD